MFLISVSMSKMAVLTASVDAAFDNIITCDETVLMLKLQAQVLAQKQVPVLIYGETGTSPIGYVPSLCITDRNVTPPVAMVDQTVPSTWLPGIDSLSDLSPLIKDRSLTARTHAESLRDTAEFFPVAYATT